MVLKIQLLALLLISFSAGAKENTKRCSSDELEGTLCRASLDMIKPTQFSIGYYPVKKKKKKFEEASLDKTLHTILKNKVIPAIIGPDRKFYIVDGHHTSSALLKAKIPQKQKQLFISVKHNCSNCSPIEFENLMTQEGHSYLYCKDFEKKSFYELPQTLKELSDNPYRSLSWIIRKKNCFNKVNVNFLEFIWGKILKEELESQGTYLLESKKKKLKALVKASCDIVKKAEYSHLPGYNK